MIKKIDEIKSQPLERLAFCFWKGIPRLLKGREGRAMGMKG
jgi:hypothetical protein